MTEETEIFSGNRSKIVFDGTVYRVFVGEKEVGAFGSKDEAIERLQSELTDLTDEATDDYNELNELDTDEEE